MFQVLVDDLLDSKVHVRERVVRLKLFQHNFHDLFNGRALFDVLEREARNLGDEKEQDDLIHDLVSLAKEITVSQELLVGSKPEILRMMKEGDSRTVALKKSEEDNDEHGENHESGNGLGHRIRIKLMRVKQHAVEVEVKIDGGESDAMQFEVSYFDAPLTDNTLLPDKHRFAITLKETNMEAHPPEATLHLLEFPADYVTTGYRPSISEANKLFRSIEQ